MITPPPGAQSFYTAILNKDAGKFIVNLVAETFAASNDIDKVMITSVDFDNDVSAIVELETGIREIASHITAIEDKIDVQQKYNPVFVPSDKDLFDLVERDEEGEVIAVDGFQSPFQITTMQVNIEDESNVIDAKVVYRPFEMPSLYETLNGNGALLS